MLTAITLAVAIGQTGAEDWHIKYPISLRVGKAFVDLVDDDQSLEYEAQDYFQSGNIELALYAIEKIDVYITSFRYARYREQEDVDMLLLMINLYESNYYRPMPEYIEEALYKRDRETVLAAAEKLSRAESVKSIFRSEIIFTRDTQLKLSPIAGFCDLLIRERLFHLAGEVAIKHLPRPVANAILINGAMFSKRSPDDQVTAFLLKNQEHLDPFLFMQRYDLPRVRSSAARRILFEPMFVDDAIYRTEKRDEFYFMLFLGSLMENSQVELAKAIWNRHRETILAAIVSSGRFPHVVEHAFFDAGMKDEAYETATAFAEHLRGVVEADSERPADFANVSLAHAVIRVLVACEKRAEAESIFQHVRRSLGLDEQDFKKSLLDGLVKAGKYSEVVELTEEEEPMVRARWLVRCAEHAKLHGLDGQAKSLVDMFVDVLPPDLELNFIDTLRQVSRISSIEEFKQMLDKMTPDDPVTAAPGEATKAFWAYAKSGQLDKARRYIPQMLKLDHWYRSALFTVGFSPTGWDGWKFNALKEIEYEGRSLVILALAQAHKQKDLTLRRAMSALSLIQDDSALVETMFDWYERVWRESPEADEENAEGREIWNAIQNNGIPLTPYWQERVMDLVMKQP